MAVIGSYKENHAFDKTRLSLMQRATAKESIDQLQEDIRKFTPKKTGRLWESISKKGPVKVSSNVWVGEVYSNLEYAASIEYGWVGRVIVPKKPGGWLKIEDTGPFVKKVVTSYTPGNHMFSKGEKYFEENHAEDIAKRNARIWLGAFDAGRRTVVF